MNSIEKARQIAMAYVKALDMDLESRLGELSLLMTDDERLIEHIEIILEILDSTRKELRKEVYVREPYMEDISKEDLVVEIAKKYGIKP